MQKYKTSKNIINTIKHFEGNLEYQRDIKKSYQNGTFFIHDDGSQYPTIGYGHNINSNELDNFKNGMSEYEAENLLKNDINNVEDDLNRIIKVPLSQNKIDALASFVFNVGAGENVTNSNTINMINKNLEFNPITGKTLEREFKEWNTSNGIIKSALKDRRNKEWDIYSNGNY